MRLPAITRPGAAAVHAHAALMLCIDGRLELEQGARYRLEPGDVFLVPAGAPHRVVGNGGSDCLGLGFHPACLGARDGLPLVEPFERVRGGHSAVVRLPLERQARLRSRIEELAGSLVRTGPRTVAVQRSLLTLVLDDVAAAMEPVDHRDRLAPSLVARCLRFIESRCLGPLTLADVAREAGRTPAHVTTALRMATGRTAGAWITAGRMAEARRRLLATDEPIEDVAWRVGYADPTHFIRTFRKEHASTPAAWRAARRSS